MGDRPDYLLPPRVEFRDDLYEGYANNVLYEASVWDLKFAFGQLDQSQGKSKVVIHSTITLPWPQIKLMVYWLRGQIEAHERVNGKINIPPGIVPPPLPPLTDEMKKLDPNSEAVFEIFTKLRNEFLATLDK
ncbi:MAG TPA: DUF3467 domain-containing protein [Candidatus Aquilonibacter sp.]|nr:DUF3467 domain-containing protein [Candidatus Aquilonibacter sp.]